MMWARYFNRLQHRALPFLFLSFLLSSLYVIVLLVVQKNSKTIAVPMAPCITIAWITGLALFS